MTRSADEPRNRFLSDPLPGLYVRTAAPIIFVMATNGLLTVIDALFLGTFVGADALTAVTMMFPVFMLSGVILWFIVTFGSKFPTLFSPTKQSRL